MAIESTIAEILQSHDAPLTPQYAAVVEGACKNWSTLQHKGTEQEYRDLQLGLHKLLSYFG